MGRLLDWSGVGTTMTWTRVNKHWSGEEIYTAGREQIVRLSVMYGATEAEANKRVDKIIAEIEAERQAKPWWRRWLSK